MNLGEYLDAINSSKVNVVRDNEVSREAAEKSYEPFVISRSLSYFEDSVLFVNELNRYSTVSKIQHFEFLLHSLRRRKRFAKWSKAEKPNDVIKAIMHQYDYSQKRAMEVVGLLNDEQKQELISKMNKGGQTK